MTCVSGETQSPLPPLSPETDTDQVGYFCFDMCMCTRVKLFREVVVCVVAVMASFRSVDCVNEVVSREVALGVVAVKTGCRCADFVNKIAFREAVAVCCFCAGWLLMCRLC